MTQNQDRLTMSLILALNGLSAVTSGIGLWWWLDSSSSAITLPYLSIGLAVLATSLLQGLILRFWSWSAEWGSWWRGVTATVFGCITSLASAGFASGIYVAMLNTAGLEEHLTDRKANTIIEPIARLSASVRHVAVGLEAIATETREKAEREEEVGGTCAGDEPEKLCGPKCRLRQRHAEEAEGLAVVARDLSSRAIDIVQDLQGDASREGMLRAFRAGHDLVSHRDLNAITIRLRREAAGFGGQFVDPRTGQSFICRDPELQARMTAVADLVAEGFVLPLVPPQPVKDLPLVDIIGKSYSDAFALAGMLLAWDFDRVRYESIAYSVKGYVPALAVEIAIIALIMLRASVRRERGCDWTDDELFGCDRRDLPSVVRRRNHRWIQMILGSLIEDRETWYIARPIDAPPDIAAAWMRLALIRRLPVDPDFGSDVPLAELFPEWAEARRESHGGARWFALHPITKRQLEWLRRAAADLESDADAESDGSGPEDAQVVDLQSRQGKRRVPHRFPAWKPALGLLILLAGGAALSLTQARLSDEPDRAEAQEGEPVLTAKAGRNGHFHVELEINGVALSAMIDTGATSLSLTYEDAEKLGLEPAGLPYDVLTNTANGKALKARVRLSVVFALALAP